MLRLSQRCAHLSKCAVGWRHSSSAVVSPVNSYNEWDPLEEIIVGRPEGSAFPDFEQPFKGGCRPEYVDFLKKMAGKPYPKELIKKASAEVEELCNILRLEGVTVKRPEYYDSARPISTPTFSCQAGYQNSCPRDIFIVMGDTIVECPPAVRSRFFEYIQYRKVLKDYFDHGAKWVAAPKPTHTEELYRQEPVKGESAVTEHEIVFDAAVFMRCGKDVFMRVSNTANQAGLKWMVRHFPQFRFHEIRFDMVGNHIDGTFVPLAPGKLLLTPQLPPLDGELRHSYKTYDGKEGEFKVPKMFKGWDIFCAMVPPPNRGTDPFWHCTNDILALNVLNLDEKRLLLPDSEPRITKQFEDWGFKPITVPFDNAMYFGGGLHCHTVDVRRRGGMQDYFS